MNDKIKIYYIPSNPNIKKGPIYTLYITNNTNLDLSNLLEENNITLNNIVNPFKENKIIIEEQTFNELLQINKQIQELLTKKTNDIKKYVEEENKNITELTNLNNKYQNLLKTFLSERKI